MTDAEVKQMPDLWLGFMIENVFDGLTPCVELRAMNHDEAMDKAAEKLGASRDDVLVSKRTEIDLRHVSATMGGVQILEGFVEKPSVRKVDSWDPDGRPLVEVLEDCGELLREDGLDVDLG